MTLFIYKYLYAQKAWTFSKNVSKEQQNFL